MYLYVLNKNIFKGLVVVSAVYLQQVGPGFKSSWSPSAWSLHVLLVLVWVLSGCFDVFPQFKDMHGVRLIGDSKFVVRLSVLCWVYPAFGSWDRLKPPQQPETDKEKKMNV